MTSIGLDRRSALRHSAAGRKSGEQPYEISCTSPRVRTLRAVCSCGGVLQRSVSRLAARPAIDRRRRNDAELRRVDPRRAAAAAARRARVPRRRRHRRSPAEQLEPARGEGRAELPDRVPRGVSADLQRRRLLLRSRRPAEHRRPRLRPRAAERSRVGGTDRPPPDLLRRLLQRRPVLVLPRLPHVRADRRDRLGGRVDAAAVRHLPPGAPRSHHAMVRPGRPVRSVRGRPVGDRIRAAAAAGDARHRAVAAS